VIWGHISIESEEQDKLQAAWDDVNAAKYPLTLLILIDGIHVGERFPNEMEGDLLRESAILICTNIQEKLSLTSRRDSTVV